LHIGDLREARERLRVMEDRERIARDLHDSVIQDLFAAGMALDAVQPLISPDEAAERVSATIDQLDATIKQIRSAIFELELHDPSSRVSDLVRRAVQGRAEQLGFVPTLELTGNLDDASVGIVDHLLAVISESLSNVARHSGAGSAHVQVSITPDGALRLVVEDDGGGFDPQRVARGQGLDNMHRRASLLGGRLGITRIAPGGGTRVVLETPPIGAAGDRAAEVPQISRSYAE
jgi:signal transduction histidine kinase